MCNNVWKPSIQFEHMDDIILYLVTYKCCVLTRASMVSSNFHQLVEGMLISFLPWSHLCNCLSCLLFHCPICHILHHLFTSIFESLLSFHLSQFFSVFPSIIHFPSFVVLALFWTLKSYPLIVCSFLSILAILLLPPFFLLCFISSFP